MPRAACYDQDCMTGVNGGFIQIKASKFPVLPGEREELVNDGMYGKALAQYLQAKLVDLGYNAPFICCEDWGWWVELRGAPFVFGVCIYSRVGEDGPVDFVCTAGGIWTTKMELEKAPICRHLNLGRQTGPGFNRGLPSGSGCRGCRNIRRVPVVTATPIPCARRAVRL